MERPERYDPEDLEHLMLERGFDELLEEERTYALRHLDGRAEYERMRDLLLRVREEHNGEASLDAKPTTRERVLHAFREQRKPRWEIWLNSVQAFLLPRHTVDLWRPALAFASVTVVLLTSVLLWRAMEDGSQHIILAEVKPPVEHAEEPTHPALEQAKPTEGPKPVVETGSNALRSAPAAPRAAAVDKPVPSGFASGEERSDTGLAESAAAVAADKAPVTQVAPAIEEADMAVTRSKDRDKTFSEVRTASTAATTASGNNATEAAKANKGAERSPYTEDDLLGLLRAAW